MYNRTESSIGNCSGTCTTACLFLHRIDPLLPGFYFLSEILVLLLHGFLFLCLWIYLSNQSRNIKMFFCDQVSDGLV